VEETNAIILANEIDRIKRIAPFDQLDEGRLGALLAHAKVVFHRHGDVVFDPALAKAAPGVWVVRQGGLRASAMDKAETDVLGEESLGVGAIFPLPSVLAGGRPRRIYTTSEDTFLWQLQGAALEQFLAETAILRWLGQALLADNTKWRESYAELLRSRQLSEQALALPAKAVGSTQVAFVSPAMTLGDAAALMAERKIGSVVVGSASAVEGIVTQTDLVLRGMAQRLPNVTPVRKVMTPDPASIDETATVFEAAIELAARRFRHLLVRNTEHSVVGVVSERDLFLAQQQGIAHVFRPIDDAQSVDAVVEVARRLHELAGRVFGNGMEISQFTRLIASINDRLTQRLLAILADQDKTLPRFCWLAFGSEGREEQGFVTDQDNGIVFAAPRAEALEEARAACLRLGQRMNDALHACGFERCQGNTMAGNPEWCLSLDEWKEKFTKWIKSSSATAILNSTIFLDFRPIYGQAELAETLRDHLLGKIKGNSLFLVTLASSALEVKPPIGRLNRFSPDGGEHKGTIDLKASGSRLFVDIARIYALANGVRAVNTEQRLRLFAQRQLRTPTAVEGDIAALRFIQRIRLQRQLDSLKDGKSANRIDPYSINELDQRVLRESFRQAQALQDRLRLDYQP
jgi:CBS domain-containing protein